MWTEFGTSDAQTVKIWSKLTFYDTIKKTYFNKFIGTGENAVVQRIMDLEKQAGDTVKFDLLYNMKSYGVDGDSVIKGFEESLRYAQDSVVIDQKRLAHRFARMSQQRTVHDLRSDGRMKLSDRWSVILDKFMAAYLCGSAGDDVELQTALGGSGSLALPGFAGNGITVPDADHVLTTGTTMILRDIDTLVLKAKTMEALGLPNIRPAMVDGEEKFVLILNPWQVKSLRAEIGANGWTSIASLAQNRGDKNPIYTGALGEYNGVVLHEWTRLPYTAAVGHGLFLGAQAAVIAFGNAYDKMDQGRIGKDNYMSWWEDNAEDYGNQKGLACGSIFGIKKTRFTDPDDLTATARDYGVIRYTTTDKP